MMHVEAFEWVARHATDQPVEVLDLGGRNVNGSPRPLFPAARSWTVLDVLADVGVDIVADAATWRPGDRRWDVVVCCEVLEHAERWPAIVATAYVALRPGGRLIVTTAAPGRALHSGVDGGPALYPGEHYGNIEPADLERELKAAGFADITVDVQPSPADVRAVATRPAL
jgi:SAM-dependent methyltransferase